MITIINRKTKEIAKVFNTVGIDLNIWTVTNTKNSGSIDDIYDAELDIWKDNIPLILSSIKVERNKKLAECDWTQTNDQKETIKSLWILYRQALRDFPDTCDPLNPIWPKPPTGD